MFKSNLPDTLVFMPKRVASGGTHLRNLRLGNTAPKKGRSDGELLATLCPI